MNPYFKAVRSLIRFIATGLILIGMLMIALEFLRHRAQGVDVSVIKVAAFALMLLAGVALLFSAGKIAAGITDEDDDEGDPEEPEDQQDTGD